MSASRCQRKVIYLSPTIISRAAIDGRSNGGRWKRATSRMADACAPCWKNTIPWHSCTSPPMPTSGESVQKPLDYYRNNVAGTATLLQTLIDFRLLPVVFSSSCATYGAPERVPIPEDHPQRPINPYGQSKLIVERMLMDLYTAYGLSSIALRYFNASGADPDGEIGEAHDPETHLIPLVITAARDGTAIRIFGTDYETPDGTCIRDYIHVADIANAHLLALDCMLGGGQSCALNLANERGHSVKEVIATTERVTGRSIRVENAPRRPGDPPVLIGTADRARSLLGWSPARSDLEHQISDAWSWVRKHLAAAHLSHHDNRRNKGSR